MTSGDDLSLHERMARMLAERLDPEAGAAIGSTAQKARASFKGFIQHVKPDYEFNWHHEIFCEAIDRWVKGAINRLMLFAPPQSGKQIGDHEPVQTVAGWKQHGELKVGDLVYSPSGWTVPVEAVAEPIDCDREIEFEGGWVLATHSNHEWPIKPRNSRGTMTKRRSTSQIAELLTGPAPLSVGCLGTKSHRVVAVRAIKPGTPGRCIQVAGGLYCVGKAMIATHNSEVVSRLLPAYLLGLNPDEAIVASSFNGEYATKNNLDVQRIMDSERYKEVFPMTRLPGGGKGDKGWKRNARTFEVVGRKGVYFCGGVGTGLSGRPFHCFPAGTAVETDFGSLGIQCVAEGLRVWSYDTETRTKELKRVVATAKYTADRMVTITAEGGVVLTCTPNHKLWDPKRWCYREAANFRAGDKLAVLNSGKGRDKAPWRARTALSVEEAAVEPQTVYDIQVADNQNFFAGGVLVSNSGILDDLYKDDVEANSPATLESVFNWYTTVFLARKSKQNARIILINTRWSKLDLAGTLLDFAENDPNADQWEVISFPALLESEEQRASGDPRKVGEALWPSRQSSKELENTRAISNTSKWSSVYQQNPTPDKGVFFTRSNFRYFSTEIDAKGILFIVLDGGDGNEPRRFAARDCLWFQTCDAADTTNARSDFTAVGTFARTPEADLCCWHVWRAKIDYPKRYKAVTGLRNGSPDEGPWPIPLAFQSMENKASGTAMIQQAAADGVPFRPLKPGASSKEQRATTVITMYENGKVFHRKGRHWTAYAEKELLEFNKGRHDEIVDIFSYAGLVSMQQSSSCSLDGELLIGFDPPRDQNGQVSLVGTSLDPSFDSLRIGRYVVEWDDDDD